MRGIRSALSRTSSKLISFITSMKLRTFETALNGPDVFGMGCSISNNELDKRSARVAH